MRRFKWFRLRLQYNFPKHLWYFHWIDGKFKKLLSCRSKYAIDVGGWIDGVKINIRKYLKHKDSLRVDFRLSLFNYVKQRDDGAPWMASFRSRGILRKFLEEISIETIRTE